jgi:hypothetical protein
MVRAPAWLVLERISMRAGFHRTRHLNAGFVRSEFLYQRADLYKDGPMRPLVVPASFATIVAPAL